jgi:hypothetical protein
VAAIKAAGGKFLAAGAKVTTIEGEPPRGYRGESFVRCDNSEKMRPHLQPVF